MGSGSGGVKNPLWTCMDQGVGWGGEQSAVGVATSQGCPTVVALYL